MILFRQTLIVSALLLLSACMTEQAWQTSNITGAMPKLMFTLTEAKQGKQVTQDDFKGKVTLLFFGFTHCPEVCPTTLLLLQQAVSKLEKQADQVQILFVSVDPDRDDLDAIKNYAENFGSQTVGLRGVGQDLEALTKKYYVAYEQSEATEDGQYDVVHSSQVYVFDREGEARLLVRATDSIDAITSDLKRLIAEKQ